MEETHKRSASPEDVEPKRQAMDDADEEETLTTTVRAIIPAKEAGAIIGRSGMTVKFIREQSQARINISDSGAAERAISVTSTAEGIFRAFSFICEKLNELQVNEVATSGPPAADAPVRPISVRLAIPNSQAGAIIGKAGSKVKEIRQATGAHVQVEKEMLPGSTERPCVISGTPEAVAQSIFHISCIMIQVPAKGPQTQYQPGSAAVMHGAYGGAGAAATFSAAGAMNPAYVRGAATASPSGTVTQHMSIPSAYIGSVIGRGGASIREIRQVSAANIKIDSSGGAERAVVITGTAEACQLAAYMIQTKVQEAMMSGGAAQ